MKKYLFLVCVGGTYQKANIELHDVRWVIGSKIEDTFDDLRNSWFGNLEGFHIDSYKRINVVDGYRINVKQRCKNNKNYQNNTDPELKLWFVNIGGYDPSSMQEKHEFGLIVAASSNEAKNIAKTKWLCGCKNKHKDDIASLKIFQDVDNCKLIKNIDNWEIELIPHESYVEEPNKPDWYGYMKIGKKN